MLALINDAIKPWDELNALLVEPFAFDPDRSDVTRMASAIAVAIKHQADLRKIERHTVDSQSAENSIMSDVADAAKHGQLRDSSRNNKLTVAACFEYDNKRGFRFIRTSVTIEHATRGELDFMATSLTALRYWMNHLGTRLQRELAVAEGPAVFLPAARLTYNPKYCINMGRTQIRMFERLTDGTYKPVDPPEVKFEIY